MIQFNGLGIGIGISVKDLTPFWIERDDWLFNSKAYNNWQL